MPRKQPTVALVYDHLMTPYGGAEIVLQTLAEAFPTAPIYTALYNPAKVPWIPSHRVKAVLRGTWCKVFERRELLDPLLPILLEQMDLSDYEVVISVTSSFAKGVLTQPTQFHFCYLLNTTRYLYEAHDSLVTTHRLVRLVGFKQLACVIFKYLRAWDLLASTRPDVIITLSQLVGERMKRVYQRAPQAILAPPVPLSPHNSNRLQKRSQDIPYYVCISRLVEYKNIQLAIKAAQRSGVCLIIAGSGRAEAVLRRTAGNTAYFRRTGQSLEACYRAAQARQANCIFWGACTDEEKTKLYQHAQAALVPGVEDFGISIIEPLQHGTPVVCSTDSGATEHLVDGTHGTFFAEQTVASLTAALEKHGRRSFDSHQLQQKAKEFDVAVFVRKFHNIFSHFYKKHATIGG